MTNKNRDGEREIKNRRQKNQGRMKADRERLRKSEED